MTMNNPKSAPRALVVLCFAAIYLIWGSTYLGIGLAVQSLPPHIMAGIRFTLSGIVLYVVMRLRGIAAPKLTQWRSAAIIGIFLLGLGNGSVSWAETMVPTGLAALLVAIVPLWMVLLDWLRPYGVRPRASVFVGIALGLFGMVLLIGPAALGLDRPLNLVGVGILVSATLAWAIGSIYSRHAPLPESPLLLTGMEMLMGGIFLFGLSIALGEWNGFHFESVTTVSWSALAYLILIGSFLGFTAHVFLLQVSTPAKVATYAYVNPVVAVFLGWAWNGERITPLTVLASGIIVAGVAIITYLNTRPQPKRESALSTESAQPTRVSLDEANAVHR
jgi:drug/metabolite transporter (DMT)-like permease